MTMTARDIMTRDVATVAPMQTVAEIAEVLAARGVSAAPVCDQNGKLLGMVSEGDLLRPFGAANACRRDWWLTLLAEGEPLARDFLDYIGRDRRQAQNLMTAPVISISPEMPASQIAELLNSHRIKRVPVVEAGRLVGIVSRADLVRALAHTPDALTESV